MLTKKRSNRLFGRIMVDSGIIDEIQLEEGLSVQKKNKTKNLFGEILMELGFIKEENIMQALVLQYPLPYIPPERYEISNESLRIIPESLMRKHKVMPIDIFGNTFTLAMANPLDKVALKEIEFIAQRKPIPTIATPSEISRVISRYYGDIPDKE